MTLESESGETVVIEQSPDGRVKCEPGRQGKSDCAANGASPKAPEPESTTAPPKTAKPKGDERAKKAASAEETTTAAKPPRASRTKPRNKKPKGALKWVPVRDHNYDGFAAPSGNGQFKVLIAKDTQWALFYEPRGAWPQHIGCFRKVDKAQARAQELHDADWPKAEDMEITAGQVAQACPVPPGQKPPDRPSGAAAQATTETKAAEPPPEPPPAAGSDAERDKGLMGSFTSELDDVLDEDEDD